MKTLKELTKELGDMLEEKQAAYGDSIEESGKFLSVLYPKGIPPENYQTVALLVRMFDKMKRIANGASNENSWQDLAGYSVQGWKISCKILQAKEELEKLKKYKEKMKSQQKLCKCDCDQFCSVCYSGSQRLYCDCLNGCNKCRSKKKETTAEEKLKIIDKMKYEISKKCDCGPNTECSCMDKKEITLDDLQKRKECGCKLFYQNCIKCSKPVKNFKISEVE